MRVVLDTNILVSVLIAPSGNPAAIYNAWEAGVFTLLTSQEHLQEVRSTLRKPAVAKVIRPRKAGRLVNQIKRLAEQIRPLPLHAKRSPDPADDFLLALAEAGHADYLVTGTRAACSYLAATKGRGFFLQGTLQHSSRELLAKSEIHQITTEVSPRTRRQPNPWAQATVSLQLCRIRRPQR